MGQCFQAMQHNIFCLGTHVNYRPLNEQRFLLAMQTTAIHLQAITEHTNWL